MFLVILNVLWRLRRHNTLEAIKQVLSVAICPDNPPDGFDWTMLDQVEQLSGRDRLLVVNRVVNRLMGIQEVLMPSNPEEAL